MCFISCCHYYENIKFHFSEMFLGKTENQSTGKLRPQIHAVFSFSVHLFVWFILINFLRLFPTQFNMSEHHIDSPPLMFS